MYFELSMSLIIQVIWTIYKAFTETLVKLSIPYRITKKDIFLGSNYRLQNYYVTVCYPMLRLLPL